jgi:phage-related minor tail protein
MASQNIARLGVVFGVDTAELETKISSAKKQFKDFATQVGKDSNAAAKDLVQLRYATEDYGKTLTKVQMIEREIQAGRYKYAEKSLTDMLLKEAAAYDAKAASMKKVTGEMTEQQKIQLGYQTTDLFTQIASGQSPLIALIQQGGQLKDVMGGFGNMFSMLASFLTPFNIAMTAAAAIVGTLGYAFYKSREDLNEFTKQIALTGSYADITAGKWADMSATIGNATKMGVGDAKDAMLELISTGKFTEKSLGAVQTAVLTYARIAGVSGVDAAKALSSGLSGNASEAKALNDKMNFLTLDQYKYIESLEKSGKTQEAAAETARLLTASLKQQESQVTGLDGVWKKITTTVSNWFNAIKTAMGPEVGSELEILTKKARQLQEALEGPINPFARAAGEKELANAKARIAVLQKEAELRKEAQAEQNAQKQKIKDYEGAGGSNKEKQLAQEQAKLIADIRYNTTVDSNNEVQKITLEAERKKQDVIAKYDAKSEEEKRAFAKENAINQALEITKIETEANQQITDLVTKQRKAATDAALKAEVDRAYEIEYTKADDALKIELDLQKKLTHIVQEQAKKNYETQYRYAAEYERERNALMESAMQDAEQARQAFRKKQFNAELDETIKELRRQEDEQKKIDEAAIAYANKNFYAAEQAKENEKLARNKLRFEIESFGLSEKQIKLKEIELQLERDIALIRMNKENQTQSAVDEAVRLATVTADAKKQTIELADSFKNIKDVQTTVWGNMSSAIDNFVRTGKMSMKDFARSVIQDLLAIQLKMQAKSLLGSLFGMLNPVGTITAAPSNGMFGGSVMGLPGFASGGSPAVNQLSIVGENGPELFIPKTAGTIVPNNKMSEIGGVTNVTNNYINAIDTKSFEERLLGSSNAIWAANQYANKSLAVNRGRA